MHKQKSKKFTKSHYLLFIVIALLVLVIGAVGYKLYKDHGNKSSKTITTTDGNAVSLTPATTDETNAADSHKQDIVESSPKDNTTTPTSQKKGEVTIVQVNSTGVKGYVTGVFEEGGTCTATATKGSDTVTKTSTGFQNASYTQCAPINWDTPLSSGSWNVTLAYKSTAAEGTKTMTIEVN